MTPSHGIPSAGIPLAGEVDGQPLALFQGVGLIADNPPNDRSRLPKRSVNCRELATRFDGVAVHPLAVGGRAAAFLAWKNPPIILIMGGGNPVRHFEQGNHALEIGHNLA